MPRERFRIGDALMGIFTPVDIAVLIVIVLLLVGGMIGLEIADRRARRRDVAAWRSYFHGGGLVRQLIARWKVTPKLTDRRDRR
jgi:hypothetical protein